MRTVFTRYGFAAAVLLTCAFILLVYSNSFRSPFVFDDDVYILTNGKIRNLANFFPPSGSRFLGDLSFAVNYRLSGFNVFGYHLANVIIHISNSILVYLLVVLTFKTPRIEECRFGDKEVLSRGIGLLSALIFAVHPVQTEAVTYITQRYASLAALFYLSSLVLFVKWRLGMGGLLGKAAYLLSLITAVFAMKTKEISFTLPVVIILYDLAFFGKAGFRQKVKYLVPFLLTMLIIPSAFLLTTGTGGFSYSEDMMRLQMKELSELSKYDYLITEFRVIVKYLRLLIVPVNQNLFYDMPFFHSIFTPEVFLSFLFLAALFVFLIVLFALSAASGNAFGLLISAGGLFFFIALSIESSIIPIQDAIFEHRLYLPSVGAFIAFATAVFYLFERVSPRFRFFRGNPAGAAGVALMLIAVIPLSIAAYSRNRVWQDELRLISDVVKKSPLSAFAHNELGSVYFKRGDVERAVEELRTAIRLKPDYFLPHYNLGFVYQSLGRTDEAIDEFKYVIMIQPDIPMAYYRLGLAYNAKGSPGQALTVFKAALAMKPDFPDLYYGLGDAYSAEGRADEAIKNYRIFIETAPDEYRQYKETAAVKIRMLSGVP